MLQTYDKEHCSDCVQFRYSWQDTIISSPHDVQVHDCSGGREGLDVMGSIFRALRNNVTTLKSAAEADFRFHITKTNSAIIYMHS
jgi:hypothetical protein